MEPGQHYGNPSSPHPHPSDRPLSAKVPSVRQSARCARKRTGPNPSGRRDHVAPRGHMLGGEGLRPFSWRRAPRATCWMRYWRKEGVPAEMRDCRADAVSSRSTRRAADNDYRFVRGGPTSANRRDSAMHRIYAAAHKVATSSGSGSLLPPPRRIFLAARAQAAENRDTRVVLDTSGDALKLTLNRGRCLPSSSPAGRTRELVGLRAERPQGRA